MGLPTNSWFTTNCSRPFSTKPLKSRRTLSSTARANLNICGASSPQMFILSCLDFVMKWWRSLIFLKMMLLLLMKRNVFPFIGFFFFFTPLTCFGTRSLEWCCAHGPHTEVCEARGYCAKNEKTQNFLAFLCFDSIDPHTFTHTHTHTHTHTRSHTHTYTHTYTHTHTK